MAVIARRSTSWFLITLGLVALVIVFRPAPKAEAMPIAEFEADYYSDATFTQQVGWLYRACGNGSQHWGVVTAYARVLWIRPCGTIDPNPNEYPHWTCEINGVPVFCP
jgi:hypothetical protein